MMRSVFLLSCLPICLLASDARAGEMKDTVKIDAANPNVLHTMFGSYGYQPRRVIAMAGAGVRFKLPGGPGKVPQTGLYSLFTLAGDCEVSCMYELVDVQGPKIGYGCGIGIGFDLADDDGRGTIQRMIRPKGETLFVLQTNLYGAHDKREEVEKSTPAKGKRGWLGLRRVKKELIFLAANDWTESPVEIERMPFSDRAIQAVRFYADSGGSPTAVDARFLEITIRAEEITGAVPKSEQPLSRAWLWGLLGVAVCSLGWLRYRSKR
jgi:hypothetical protein